MYFLKIYIDFSQKYKILVKDSLNEDIKRIIWQIYKQLICQNIIKSFIEKKIFKCRDCNTARWNLMYGINQQFYYVNMCDHEDYYYTDVHCCIKFICLENCKFTIECINCKKIDKYSPNKSIDDVGWNPVEDKKFIIIECKYCGFLNNKELVWYNDIHPNSICNRV